MFTEILGNEYLKETFRRLRRAERMPNSAILCGPEGVGKRQFALDIARSFACRSGNVSVCGTCPACMRIGEFELPKPDDRDAHKSVVFTMHLDAGLVIAYNRTILVDAIRHLESEAQFRPFEADARVFLIDDADKMNASSSNALLKTLEEPIPTTYLFLITSRPDKLLPTIRSRCQIFRFAPVPTREIEEHLIAAKGMPAKDAALAARLANGSIGRALAIEVGEYVDRRGKMLEIVAALAAGNDRARLLKLAEELSDPRRKEFFEQDLDILEGLIRDAWLAGQGGPAGSMVNLDIAERLAEISAAARFAQLAGWIIAIGQLREDLSVNVNRKIRTDALVLEMAG